SATSFSCSVPATSCSRSGCSGAITKNVAPNNVSGRVVNTVKSMSSSSQWNTASAPSERPIQLCCIVTTRSGHDSSSLKSSSSRSAYSVILKNHCSSCLTTTSVPQRSQ